MIGRQGAGIAFRLHPRGIHRAAPARGAAPGGAAFHPGRGGLPDQIKIIIAALRRRAIGIAALLGFKDEAVPLVAIDPAKAARAIGFFLKHAAFKHIIVGGIIRPAAMGRGNADQRAQAVDEALRIGQFRTAGGAPIGNKVNNFASLPHPADNSTAPPRWQREIWVSA